METKIYKITDPELQQDEINEAAEFLRRGELVAFPTETVYGLGANALNAEAVKKIFEAKGRPQDNPLIVHISGIKEIYQLVRKMPERALKLMSKFWPGPLTVVLPKSSLVPDEVSAGLDTVAVRMPSHPVARALIKAAGVPVAAPSANISGFPSPTAFKYVCDDMCGRIPVIIDGGDCDFGIESTVVSLAEDTPKLLRPGAITHRQLEEILGRTEIDKSVLKPLKRGMKAASPGMKYKHYAPKAQLQIVRGNLDEFISYAGSHSEEADYILCFEGEEKFMPLPAVTMGREENSLSQARRLFDALRELDERGAKKVFSRSPSENGVGLGVCNRLYRAAGFRFLNEKRGIIIGIGGGTGAGKSTVCAMLKERGAVIVDADLAAREITKKGSPVLKELQKHFGKDILDENGELRRRELAKRAFSSKENTRLLTQITNPPIIEKCLEDAQRLSVKHKITVIDAPLLFSSGMNKNCDLTVRVEAPESVRLARIINRDGINRDEAVSRLFSQNRETCLCRAADVTVKNYPPYNINTEIEKIFSAMEEIL